MVHKRFPRECVMVHKRFSQGVHNGTQEVSQGVRNGTQKVSQGVHNGTQEVSQWVHNGTQKVSQGVHNGTQEVSQGVRNGTQEVSQGVRNGTQKVSQGVCNGTQEVSQGVRRELAETKAKCSNFATKGSMNETNYYCNILKFTENILYATTGPGDIELCMCGWAYGDQFTHKNMYRLPEYELFNLYFNNNTIEIVMSLLHVSVPVKVFWNKQNKIHILNLSDSSSVFTCLLYNYKEEQR